MGRQGEKTHGKSDNNWISPEKWEKLIGCVSMMFYAKKNYSDQKYSVLRSFRWIFFFLPTPPDMGGWGVKCDRSMLKNMKKHVFFDFLWKFWQKNSFFAIFRFSMFFYPIPEFFGFWRFFLPLGIEWWRSKIGGGEAGEGWSEDPSIPIFWSKIVKNLYNLDQTWYIFIKNSMHMYFCS